jgi:hypothetical protein
VLRPSIGKLQPKVYDFVDSRVGVLDAAARARAAVYGEIFDSGGPSGNR